MDEKKMTQQESGRMGGMAKVKKGFAMMDRKRFVEVASAGGKKLRKPKTNTLRAA
jgi:general stress protein YciG